MYSLLSLTCAGAAIRTVLLVYATIQDAHPTIKYTDIDYSVFSDAAAYLVSASPPNSPYARSTYRYTPLLAYMMVPNTTLHPLFGKILFCICDLGTGAFLFALLLILGKTRGGYGPASAEPGMSMKRAWLYSALWTLNPFVAVISTRGSAESVVSVLVLGALWGVLSGKVRLGAVLFGTAVHFKIYPIIYAIPFWFGIDWALASLSDMPKNRPAFKLCFWSWRRVEFAIISGGTFLALTYAMYILHGEEFINEAYLYHVTRKDHRHNFSLYFYEMYLKHERTVLPSETLFGTQTVASVFGAVESFVPQFGLVGLLGVMFAHDLPTACFLQTFAFVMLNKVCTSQYFLWYICLLPLVLPFSRLTGDRWKHGVALTAAWVFGQALWLSQAYRLEHLGHNTFMELWVAGIVFFVINVTILNTMIVNQYSI
ncbi:hypothetical protein BASA50_010051 [Batrachochytrium salamandrivorans]|uniref:GPI mannosyltransferase 1 n=1 Tax=Batrachochytrium salamandrivorans TaxID=1357716 RepID=A0ABQ8F007_9FUNG|nr:hypothetical protein BASA62_002620 [Batrachochytrium salamandrivorans]KAH6583092.1 hypothetical protein BASA61_008184 [Batrachochytrium salamandrivorans]KAH6589397.1 hypothetical protein BASA50_010051 [Batrachochytrium salamandrivorans]KAH9270991.1 hypothetical protein BASA83_006743 [Batrachochytrium salamandrivorans]